MTITIDLSPELESRLRESALAAGIDAQSYAVSVLAANLPRNPRSAMPCLSAEESRLMHEITRGMPSASWHRYRELGEKLRAETISSLELDEFRSLTDTIELANSKRLEQLVELARLRNTSLDVLMAELGIRNEMHV